MGNNNRKSIPIDISQIQDKTLQGIENRIRKFQHEEAFLFDESGNLVSGVSGGTTSVDVPRAWDSLDGATTTHNHPTQKYGFGGALSMDDVKRMADTQWKEMRAVASGKGEFNYIMRRTSKSDNEGLKRTIANDIVKLENEILNEYKNAYNEAKRNGKSESNAMRIGAQKGTGIAQAYWKKTLPQFGFEYITPKKEYDYNGR